MTTARKGSRSRRRNGLICVWLALFAMSASAFADLSLTSGQFVFALPLLGWAMFCVGPVYFLWKEAKP